MIDNQILCVPIATGTLRVHFALCVKKELNAEDPGVRSIIQLINISIFVLKVKIKTGRFSASFSGTTYD